MRISDWSSDVCSSDLHLPPAQGPLARKLRHPRRCPPRLLGSVPLSLDAHRQEDRRDAGGVASRIGQSVRLPVAEPRHKARGVSLLAAFRRPGILLLLPLLLALAARMLVRSEEHTSELRH